MQNYYFTFGSNHQDKEGNSLGNNYVPIQAKSETEARHLMYKARGEVWAFSYTEDEKASSIDRYNLTLRNLEDVTLYGAEISV